MLKRNTPKPNTPSLNLIQILILAMNNPQFDQKLQTWQRLSPLSIIFFIGKTLSRLIKDALSGMAPLAVIIFNSDHKLWMVASILIGLLALLIISSFLQYWFFKYKQQDQKVLINDGVFKKNHRVIQFDRIQNINILQPLYFRPFSLVTLQIETAGAKGNEADLAGISREFAEFLKNQVLLQQQLTNNDPADNQDQAENTQVIAQASLLDLMKYGVSSNGIFWFFIFLAPMLGLADDFLEKIFTKEDFVKMTEFVGGGTSGEFIVLLGMLSITLLLMFCFSILGAILRYFRYQLTLDQLVSNPEKSTLKRSSGLLTSYEESLKLQKIQTLISQSNFIGRWLKVNNLILGQVSNSQNNAKNKKSLFVIPARTDSELADLQKVVFGDAPSEIQTKGINRRYIYKTIALKILMPSLLICSTIYFTGGPIWLLALPVLLSLLMLPLVIRRWKAYQYGMKDGYGQFQRGLFGFRHILFPLYKVQRAEVRQSPIQRRRNLATLKIYLASNRIQMQYIPFEEAHRWLDIISRQIEGKHRAWY
jgi:putative membrane protein